MKYLKTFEKIDEHGDDILYSNSDFTIFIQDNDAFCYSTKDYVGGAISGMAIMIRDFPKYKNNKKLRQIPIKPKYIDETLRSLTLSDNRVKIWIINYEDNNDIHKFSGYLPYFCNFSKDVPISAFIKISKKYYPIISDNIKDSKTLGDIIDKFKIIKENIEKDLPLFIRGDKYNIL